MYSILIGTERAISLTMLIVSCMAGHIAFKLIQQPAEKRLYYYADKLLHWSVRLALLAALHAAINLSLSWTVPPSNGIDRLIVRVPLAISLLLTIWLAVIPRLRRLLKRTQAQSEQTLDISRIRKAAHPMLTAPFPIGAAATAALLLFSFVSPQMVTRTTVITSSAGLVLLALLIWIYQVKHYESVLAEATAADAALTDQAIYYNQDWSV